jgi:1-acyl-sn-glycerol-3-phosphate acyltransferase
MNFYYWFGYHFSRWLAKLLFRFRIVHRHRMIQSGPVILAMNHQSYLDPPLAGNASDRSIYFFARRTLLDVPVLKWLLPKLNVIPVDQEGMDRTSVKAVIRLLRANEGVLIFPEGSRTLDGNLQPGLPGVGLIIAKTFAPVVPMRIFGAHEALPRGGNRLRLARITVVVGEPIYFTASDFPAGDKTAYGRASQRVMEAIAALELE